MTTTCGMRLFALLVTMLLLTMESITSHVRVVPEAFSGMTSLNLMIVINDVMIIVDDVAINIDDVTIIIDVVMSAYM